MSRVHIQGAGTIGAPLAYLLADRDTELGLDRVTFTKHTPRRSDAPIVDRVREAGAEFVVDEERTDDFDEAGFDVDGALDGTVEEATVVVEATPSGIALDRKPDYETMDGPEGFLAQGSEAGFGTPFALGVNNDVLDRVDDRFVHVVSCNTHNISALTRALADHGDGLDRGRVVCIRRATDVGDHASGPLAPKLALHDADEGTHHAEDVVDLYGTTGRELDLFSSAIKIPTQFMHTIWFQFDLDEELGREDAIDRFEDDEYLAVTDKMNADLVFNMGRQFGPFGRILNQGVVARESIHTDGSTVSGFCFTPQDGNAILSNVAAVSRFVHPNEWRKRLAAFDDLLVDEI
jgi:glyceraldehyde-3-phosphate dehydrogenase (NAD(P))